MGSMIIKELEFHMVLGFYIMQGLSPQRFPKITELGLTLYTWDRQAHFN